MSSLLSRGLWIVVPLLAATTGHVAHEATEEDRKRLAKLIKQLGDDEYAQRERATIELKSAGEWALPDLASRMSASLVLHLAPLGESDQIKVLRLRAKRRGLELPDDVGQYLLRRMPRDLRSLCALLDTLDMASLAKQRRLTVPFIRQILGPG